MTGFCRLVRGTYIIIPTQTYEGIKAEEIIKEISCDPWLEKHFPGQNMSQKILDELERIRAEVQGK